MLPSLNDPLGDYPNQDITKRGLKAVPYVSVVHYTYIRCMCAWYISCRIQANHFWDLANQAYSNLFTLFMKPAHLTACFLLALLQVVCLSGPVIGAAYGGSGGGGSSSSTGQLADQAGKTDAQANITQSNSYSGNKKPPDSRAKPEPDMELAGFFLIGLIINLMVMAAFVNWAIKQWKKHP